MTHIPSFKHSKAHVIISSICLYESSESSQVITDPHQTEAATTGGNIDKTLRNCSYYKGSFAKFNCQPLQIYRSKQGHPRRFGDVPSIL